VGDVFKKNLKKQGLTEKFPLKKLHPYKRGELPYQHPCVKIVIAKTSYKKQRRTPLKKQRRTPFKKKQRW